jgi:hypothetical protein
VFVSCSLWFAAVVRVSSKLDETDFFGKYCNVTTQSWTGNIDYGLKSFSEIFETQRADRSDRFDYSSFRCSPS